MKNKKKHYIYHDVSILIQESQTIFQTPQTTSTTTESKQIQKIHLIHLMRISEQMSKRFFKYKHILYMLLFIFSSTNNGSPEQIFLSRKIIILNKHGI